MFILKNDSFPFCFFKQIWFSPGGLHPIFAPHIATMGFSPAFLWCVIRSASWSNQFFHHKIGHPPFHIFLDIMIHKSFTYPLPFLQPITIFASYFFQKVFYFLQFLTEKIFVLTFVSFLADFEIFWWLFWDTIDFIFGEKRRKNRNSINFHFCWVVT